MLSGQTLLVTPSLTCSSAANYHLNFPRPAPIWPCSSVGEQRRSVPEVVGSNPTTVRDFFSFSHVGPISFVGLSLRLRYYFGYLYSTSTYHILSTITRLSVVCTSVCTSLCTSLCRSVCRPVCTSVCALYICLCVCLYICL